MTSLNAPQLVEDKQSASAAGKLVPSARRLEMLAKPITRFHEAIRGDLPLHGKIRSILMHQFQSYYFVQTPMWRMLLRSLASDRVVPDFASIGAVRSGTSALSQYIFQHPCVVLPIAKEPHLRLPTKRFCMASFPRKKEMDAARSRLGAAATGYCTPIVPDLTMPYLMRAINPACKIVLILRNPIDRVLSHWQWDQLLTAQWNKDALWKYFPDFKQMVDIEFMSLASGGGGLRTMTGNGNGYLLNSIYLPFIRVLREQLNDEQIHIVCAEEFFAEPLRIAKEVYAFLGLPDCEPLQVSEKNASGASTLDGTTRKRLSEFFRPHNERLFEYLGRDFGWDK